MWQALCSLRGKNEADRDTCMDKILNWFALKHIPGIGNLLFKRLFDRFKSPDTVFDASREELLQVEGMTARAAAIRKHSR